MIFQKSGFATVSLLTPTVSVPLILRWQEERPGLTRGGKPAQLFERNL